MNVLVDLGGRETYLELENSTEQFVRKIFIAPGNAGTASLGENIPIAVDDFEAMKDLVLEHNIAWL